MRAALGWLAPVGMIAAAPAMASSCGAVPGLDAVRAEEARFLVFGELHGTQEAPAFFGNVVCQLAEAGDRILAAVELQASGDAALQKAWAGPHERFAADVVANLNDWRFRKDGVTSQAMLAMLTELHRLKSAGRPIDIVAFNSVRDEAQRARFAHLPGQGPHEAAQAENIRIAAAAKPYDRVLVLIGNFHAQGKPVLLGEDSIEPMAMHLGRSADVLTLNMSYGSGSSWVCLSRAADPAAQREPAKASRVVCDSHSFEIEPVAGPARIELGGEYRMEGRYDGAFILPTVNASPPVLPSDQASQ